MDPFKLFAYLVAFISTFFMAGTNATSLNLRRTREDSTFPPVPAATSSSSLNLNTDSGQNDGELGETTTKPVSSTSARPAHTRKTTTFPPHTDTDIISRVNMGVSTILGGVRTGSLEQILRGSFLFTRNENVKSVANNVLDNLFPKSTATATVTSSPSSTKLPALQPVVQQTKTSPLELKRLELELEERKETMERLAERIRLLEEKNISLREEILRSKVTTTPETAVSDVKFLSTDGDTDAVNSSTTKAVQN